MSIPDKSEIPAVFNEISAKYDRINRLLSGYQDVLWRWKLARTIRNRTPDLILDLATGTADVLISLATHGIQFKHGIGLDPAVDMLAIGNQKLKTRHLSTRIELKTGVATAIPLTANSVDVITLSFGIRNVPDYEAALVEMKRVLKPGGEALILEFSLPSQPIRTPYLWYLRTLLPRLGRWLSGHATAYTYLNKTIESFPYGSAFEEKLLTAGFSSVRSYRMSAGVVTLYHAQLD
ncbi:MAG: ubiquinone/menaquinone biosynthesis methyltransferase [Candidatus Marinamargulisbacteria bacterium]|jgi:demethylmenaquinone methyltransferase / 2-methoxy-6-polyprenyl-1,4-benzoquinol methylase|nr:bifunctional demethylmenaquinone methyltransferase/2-methoxy-6-polyprenyl-1,4-benzoquinol methylase [bacterium]MDG2264750.1 ubiquinone/menaquinone biosynthesis methyltransferase [Candidatus Marinamargulisbacteria bacterium]|tara:strand:+ start:4477 stop:5181 length:705 start_codon:yes stop_codon:yes gene_type:complete